jgi:hypothetical protein
MRGDQTLGSVEHIDGMCTIRRGHRHADPGPAMKIMRPCLGGRDIEFPLQLGDYGPNQRTLLLERAHVTEQQIELEPADPHPRSATRRRRGLGGVGAKRQQDVSGSRRELPTTLVRLEFHRKREPGTV